MSSKEYLRLLKHRMKKAEAKICQFSGCHESAYFMCPRHLKVMAEANKRSYQRRKRKNDKKIKENI